MKAFDFIKANIGNLVYCQGNHNYNMSKTKHRQITNRPLVIIRLMKTGLVEVQNLDGDLNSVKATLLREYDDDSITDAQLIRQIALYSIEHCNFIITKKTKKEFMYAGLYPHTQKIHNIKPDKMEKKLIKLYDVPRDSIIDVSHLGLEIESTGEKIDELYFEGVDGMAANCWLGTDRIQLTAITGVYVKYTVKKTKESLEPGFIYTPWVIAERDPNDTDTAYDDFMKEYNRLHECCPKCGATDHASTLVGYILDVNKPDKYKDENRCTCSECGDVHIAHDRVPKQ